MSEPVRRPSGGFFAPRRFLFSVLHINSSLLRVKSGIRGPPRRREREKSCVFPSPPPFKCKVLPVITQHTISRLSSPKILPYSLPQSANSTEGLVLNVNRLYDFHGFLLLCMRFKKKKKKFRLVILMLQSPPPKTRADMCSQEKKKTKKPYLNQARTGNLETILRKQPSKGIFSIACRRLGCLCGGGRR